MKMLTSGCRSRLKNARARIAMTQLPTPTRRDLEKTRKFKFSVDLNCNLEKKSERLDTCANVET